LIVPLWQMFLMATRFLLLFVGSDSILNDIYMTQRLKMVREKSMADKSKIRDLLDIELDDDEDLGNVLATNLPTLDEVLHRFSEDGHNRDPLEQLELKRQLTRLARIVKAAQQAKQKRIEHQLAQEFVEEQARMAIQREVELREAQEEAAAKAPTAAWRQGVRALGFLFGNSSVEQSRSGKMPTKVEDKGDERMQAALAVLKRGDTATAPEGAQVPSQGTIDPISEEGSGGSADEAPRKRERTPRTSRQQPPTELSETSGER